MRLSTATEIKNIKEIGCHTVTGPKGLQLRVKQKSKTYFLRYTFSGKRKLIRLGSADFISLAQAREKGFEILELLEKESIRRKSGRRLRKRKILRNKK